MGVQIICMKYGKSKFSGRYFIGAGMGKACRKEDEHGQGKGR